MTCDEFTRHLDEGRSTSGGAMARHARSCPACAAAARAHREVESELSLRAGRARSPSAPALSLGFTDRVMQRVRASRREVAGYAPLPESMLLPWWVRAAAQPAVVLASLAAALLFWLSQDLWKSAAGIASLGKRLADLSPAVLGPLWPRLSNPWVLVGLIVPISLASVWICRQLFRWCSRLFGPGRAPAERSTRVTS